MSDSTGQTGRSRVEIGLAFSAGALFAVGLAVSGMTQPAKVVGFLDVAGRWDPSLAFVMAGAVGVYFVAQRWFRNRSTALLGAEIELPARHSVDVRLVTGAAIFGVGWGLSGFCPGPALTSLGSGSLAAVVFVVAMGAGMLVFRVLENAGRPR